MGGFEGGGDPALLRVPSVVFGVATIPVVCSLGLRTVGRWAGAAAAGFLAISPFALYYSVEARPYATLMFFAALSALLLLVAFERGKGWWIAFGLSVAATLYSHYTGLFVVGAECAWALTTQRGRGQELLVAYGVAVAAYLPWIPSVKGEELDVYGDVAKLLDLSATDALLNWLGGHPFLAPEPLPLILLGVALLIGALSTLSGGNVWARSVEALRGPVGLVVSLAVITPVAIFVYSLVSTDLFPFARNLIASLPFAALLIGWVLTQPSPRIAIVAILLAGAGLATATAMDFDSSRSRPDYPGVASRLDDLAQCGDRAFFSSKGLSSRCHGPCARQVLRPAP